MHNIYVPRSGAANKDTTAMQRTHTLAYLCLRTHGGTRIILDILTGVIRQN